MVAQFDTINDANSYLAQLLPAWKPEADYAPEWLQLFQAQAVAGPGLAYGEMPRDLLAIGRSVLAMGYGLEDQFPELRALAWKQGAASMSGGIHSHEVTLLAAVRTASADEARKLAAVEWADEFSARPFIYGDTLLLVMGLMGQEGELEACKRGLEALADGRPLAVEVHSDIVSSESMLEVMKRLGAPIHQTPRLVLQFWGGDPAVAQKKAAHFAQMVTEAEVTAAAACVLISGLSRRKRLAVLAYRQGATVGALDAAELQVSARLVLPELPRQKGRRAVQPSIDIALLQDELRLSLWPGVPLQVEQGYRGAAQVRVTSTQPERVLETLKQAAQRLGATTHFWVSEPQALAMAVRRLLAEVRESRE